MMKTKTSRGSRAWATWVLCILGVALPTVAIAGVKEGTTREKPQPGEPISIGDETIGTLPMQQGAPLLQLRRDLEVVRPSVFLEGDRNEVCNVIVSVAGANSVQVVPLDPQYTRVRVIFPGEALIGCDRLALEGSDIKVGMWLPDPHSDAYPECTWGLRHSTIANATQRVELPVTVMSAAGALGQRALFVHAGSTFGATQLAVSTDADFVYLFQRH